MNKRFLVIPLAAAAAAAIAFVASNSGADFDATSPQGTISGQAGTVTVIGNHNGSLDIAFPAPFTPGVWASTSTSFTITGTVNEDVYVTFPNQQALHAFNQQGRFVQAAIDVDGGQVWSSANLNDGFHTGATPMGPYNCSTTTVNSDGATPQICPLDETRLLSNVGPGDHTFTFWYLLNSKATNSKHFVDNTWQGRPFNPYPVDAAGDIVSPTGDGLPYEFYATQAGGAAPATDISFASVG